MMRYHQGAMTRVCCLALVMAAPACGKKDAGPTGDARGGTATAYAVRVTEVKMGRAIGADKRVTEETEEFRPSDVIYAVVETKGSAPNASLQARWTYEDGQVVDQATQSIAPTGEDVTEFHVSKPSGWPKGKYKVEILLNGVPVDSEDFKVE
jgi:hypothetical protein